jgi:hypothetical protein
MASLVHSRSTSPEPALPLAKREFHVCRPHSRMLNAESEHANRTHDSADSAASLPPASQRPSAGLSSPPVLPIRLPENAPVQRSRPGWDESLAGTAYAALNAFADLPSIARRPQIRCLPLCGLPLPDALPPRHRTNTCSCKQTSPPGTNTVQRASL